MKYFSLLDFKKEPFSNSPDPDFFFESRQHKNCLQQLELGIRLNRGLHIVSGNVGTGKTTLSRRLVRSFSSNEDILSFLILDPAFETPEAFLDHLHKCFRLPRNAEQITHSQIKEDIKNFLLFQAIKKKKTIVLVIDEGQKLSRQNLEILREFLNYETNNSKLLQIIIFAQPEIDPLLEKTENLTDRINVFYRLEPLDLKDTRGMITFRLQCAAEEETMPNVKFSFWAIREIYNETSGYPRKIINLCHRVIMAMVLQNKRVATRRMVKACVSGKFQTTGKKSLFSLKMVALTSLCALAVLIPFHFFSSIHNPLQSANIHQNRNMKYLPIKDSTLHKANQNTSAVSSTAHSTKHQPEKQSIPLKSTTNSANSLASSSTNLGDITIAKGDILSKIVHIVYGVSDPVENKQYVHLLALANPHINDMNILSIGKVLHFPAIRVPAPARSKYFIVLDQKDNLESAYREIYGKLSFLSARPQVLCYAQPGHKRAYAIAWPKYYSTYEEARNMLVKFPEFAGAHLSIQKITPETKLYSILAEQ